MIVLTQFSYTSTKNCLIASSVAGAVGFAAMEEDVLEDRELVFADGGGSACLDNEAAGT